MSKEFDEMTPEEKAAKNIQTFRNNLTNGPYALMALQRELVYTRAQGIDDQELAELYVQIFVELMLNSGIRERKIMAALLRATKEMHAW